MSCGGNRFSCGIKRYQKAQFAPDRPSNLELHKENESRLSELMRLREEQDKMLYSVSTIQTEKSSENKVYIRDSEEVYYPWVKSDSPQST